MWLVENGLEELVDQVTDRKPPSMVNLDDRGVCFKGDFDAALAEIESFRPFWQVPEPEPCEKHNCTGHTFYDSYFPSIIFCKETDDGHFIAGSPACESEVAFCPYCGKQAPKPPRPPREYDE